MQRILILILSLAFVVSVNAADVTKSTIDVKGMKSNECIEKVTAALQQVDGVEKVSVDLESGQATIEYKGVELASLNSAIVKAGFKTGSTESKKYELDETEAKTCLDADKAKCARKCEGKKKEI